MNNKERSKLETFSKIRNYAQALGIEEGFLRTGIKSIGQADDAETTIRDFAFKGVQAALMNGEMMEAFLTRVYDSIHHSKEDDITEWFLKVMHRGNGGDLRLSFLLELVVDTYVEANQEIGEYLSEIVHDYFLNYASSGQKSFIASDLLEVYEETQQ